MIYDEVFILKYLITGGCGFIGTSLIRELVSSGSNAIRVLDNLEVGSKEDLRRISEFQEPTQDNLGWCKDGNIQLVVGSILDSSFVTRVAKDADVIVHLAANTGVEPSVKKPMADCKTNVVGTLNVLEAARSGNVGRFVFASSGAPLGAQVPPLHEEMAPHPASPYGASKLAGEGYCSAYFQCFGLETVILRFGNVYGPGSTNKESVVAKFIKRAQKGLPLEIYGDGHQTRDFIFISDLVRAIKLAAVAVGAGGETFQIASSRETTVSEITRSLVSILSEEGLDSVNVVYKQLRDGDVERNFSDTTKARDILGWSPIVSLEQGLRKTVTSFLINDGL
ncbi:GDP-mannose 4,6-dehydratase [Pseudomonadales bacterium]|nr:GDP-mannose 4,6-dehydratase [Pseudomonadales bacterium]